jgi:hypothetical protein
MRNRTRYAAPRERDSGERAPELASAAHRDGRPAVALDGAVRPTPAHWRSKLQFRNATDMRLKNFESTSARARLNPRVRLAGGKTTGIEPKNFIPPRFSFFAPLPLAGISTTAAGLRSPGGLWPPLHFDSLRSSPGLSKTPEFSPHIPTRLRCPYVGRRPRTKSRR